MVFTPHMATHMARQWLNWTLLCLEASQVIALRTSLIVAGGPASARESERMVEEKVRAMMQAGTNIAWGQWGTTPQSQAEGATRFYRRKVRANLRRLT
ncbi:MAG: hypothetical protein KGJ57_03690 [Sphingomonadales bacterium]|nr:hypothetical protein [Sphingomonadales bacterium]MDE2168513.1 hypothetical protein [Sphingomonadales bacterium]